LSMFTNLYYVKHFMENPVFKNIRFKNSACIIGKFKINYTSYNILSLNIEPPLGRLFTAIDMLQ
jgi:hypothetical protein